MAYTIHAWLIRGGPFLQRRQGTELERKEET